MRQANRHRCPLTHGTPVQEKFFKHCVADTRRVTEPSNGESDDCHEKNCSDHRRIFLGAFLEIILAISGIGTGVALFPLLKWENEGLALGYVTCRVIKSAIIVAGIIALLSVVTLRHEFATEAGGDAAAFVIAGRSLVAFHNWTFLLGPGVAPGVNDMLLGYLLYRTGLLPRAVGLLGMVGGPVLLASSTANLFGLFEQISVWSAIATIPVFVFEATVGIWLTVKGFNSAPIIAVYDRQLESRSMSA